MKILEIIEKKEYTLLLFLQKRRNAKLDFIMQRITRLSDKGMIWFVLAFGMLLSSSTRLLGLGLILGLFMHISFCHILLKNIIKRPRPNFSRVECFSSTEEMSKENKENKENIERLEYRDLKKAQVRKLKDYSFPSGHVTSSVISLTLLWTFDSIFFYPALLFTILIAFSRLYLGEHYPSDVIGAIAIGYTIGILLSFILLAV